MKKEIEQDARIDTEIPKVETPKIDMPNIENNINKPDIDSVLNKDRLINSKDYKIDSLNIDNLRNQIPAKPSDSTIKKEILNQTPKSGEIHIKK